MPAAARNAAFDRRGCPARLHSRTSTAPYFHPRIIISGDDDARGESFMLTFETADQKEVRRFRIAQFNGRAVTVRSEGSAVTGHVRSGRENKPNGAEHWTITLFS